MSGFALHYTVGGLDVATMLKPHEEVILSPNAIMFGVCNSSCGPGVLKKHATECAEKKPYKLTFPIRPVSSPGHTRGGGGNTLYITLLQKTSPFHFRASVSRLPDRRTPLCRRYSSGLQNDAFSPQNDASVLSVVSRPLHDASQRLCSIPQSPRDMPQSLRDMLQSPCDMLQSSRYMCGDLFDFSGRNDFFPSLKTERINPAGRIRRIKVHAATNPAIQAH
jgi:hypothetical protein